MKIVSGLTAMVAVLGAPLFAEPTHVRVGECGYRLIGSHPASGIQSPVVAHNGSVISVTTSSPGEDSYLAAMSIIIGDCASDRVIAYGDHFIPIETDLTLGLTVQTMLLQIETNIEKLSVDDISTISTAFGGTGIEMYFEKVGDAVSNNLALNCACTLAGFDMPKFEGASLTFEEQS